MVPGNSYRSLTAVHRFLTWMHALYSRCRHFDRLVHVQVFINIRDDEVEHKKTMVACQSTAIAKDIAEAAKKF